MSSSETLRAGSGQGPGAGPRLVVVLDTDAGVRWALQKGLERTGYVVRVAATAGDALQAAHRERVEAVLMELLPEVGLSLEVLSALLSAPGSPRVVCTSAEADPKTVIDCVRRGASDFLPKPFSLVEVRKALGRVLADGQLRGASSAAREPERDESDETLLIGISPALQELRETIRQVAQTDLNCLVRGESGTGKDLIAREIHRLSRRRDKPFVKVNCSALPEPLLESELFGFEKGAFTGAVSSKPGRFELANRGIIFLDEIGELHPNLQAKLLQVLEHKEFTKLGGTRHIRVDVQIVAATNADLEQKTKEGTFRDDLYFRLNELCVWVPPLSERKEDVPLLVRHFIQKHGRSGDSPQVDIAGEALEALTAHDWPGNVRELESTIKRWLALGKLVISGERPRTLATSRTAPSRHDAFERVPLRTDAPSGEEPERGEILAALEKAMWNRRKAAEALGMSYQTLRRRIDKYKLDTPL